MNQENLCYYANRPNHLQILKVKKDEKIFWERGVFPQERLFFSAHYSDELEVYGKMANQLTKIENISCQYLLFVDDKIGDYAFVSSSVG